jgi:hypothetical protein
MPGDAEAVGQHFHGPKRPAGAAVALVPDGAEAGARGPLVPRVKVLGQVDVGRVGALQGHGLRQGGDVGVASLGSAEHLQFVDLKKGNEKGFNHFSSARLPPSIRVLKPFTSWLLSISQSVVGGVLLKMEWKKEVCPAFDLEKI